MTYTKRKEISNNDSIINFVVPVRNEQKNLEPFLLSLLEAVSYVKLSRWKLYFVLSKNGNIDNSEKIILDYQLRLPKKIKVLVSGDNKTAAQIKAVKEIKNSGVIIFLDSDTTLDQKAIFYVSKTFESNRILIMGGMPIPRCLDNGLFTNLIYNLLNFGSIYQNILKPCHIINNYYKNYFNGRFFALRSKKYWLLNDDKLPDDIILIDMIYNQYGLRTFKFVNRAISYYEPYLSFKKHYLAHLKNYFFLRDLKYKYPEFKKYQFLYAQKLNFKVFVKLKNSLKFLFLIWLTINLLENSFYFIYYSLYRYKIDGKSLWSKSKITS